jgi:hypothetical protein
MSANHDLERRIADFYADEGPQRAPDRVLEQVLTTIDTTSQRHVLGPVPWRIPTMNSYAKLAIAAAVVIAVGALGLAFLRPGQGPGVGGPGESASPSTSPSATGSQPVSPPPLSETFTSSMNGLSISYPAGWVAVPATEPWTTQLLNFQSPASDHVYDPVLQDQLFLGLASRALEGEAGDAWARAFLEDPREECAAPPEAVSVDGAEGLLCGTVAFVWTADRGYMIRLYTSSDEPWLADTYDRAWFDDVLATVQLQPEDAVDGVSPSPSQPSPSAG